MYTEPLQHMRDFVQSFHGHSNNDVGKWIENRMRLCLIESINHRRTTKLFLNMFSLYLQKNTYLQPNVQ